MPDVFISYRREDTSGHAGRLYDTLAGRLGRRHVFMDVDSIRGGEDFAERIEHAISSCDAVLVMIGDEWLTVRDAAGARRIDDPGDFVRLEVETALRSDVPIIPVLVAGAEMPGPSDLPEPIRELTRQHGVELSSSRWRFDVRRVLDSISSVGGRRAGSPLGRAAFRAAALPRWGKAAGLVAIAAVVVAVAIAALSGGSSPPLRFRLGANASRSVLADVPDRWGVVTRAGESGESGNAMVATLGPDVPSRGIDWHQPRIYIGASVAKAKSLGLASLTPAAALTKVAGAELNDWSQDGCRKAGLSVLRRTGYAGRYQRWENCDGTPNGLWELAAMTADRRAVISMQVMVVPKEHGTAPAERALRTFRVAPGLLPTQAATSGSGGGDSIIP